MLKLNFHFISSLFLFAIIFSNVARGDVWKSERDWTIDDEGKFTAWIASDSFNKRIFIDSTSP